MKILGYIDDGMNWFINWQTSLSAPAQGFMIALEIILIFFGILIFWDNCRTGGNS